MLSTILSALILLAAAIYAVVLIREALIHKEETKKETGSILIFGLTEAAIWFLATFGVSDSAMNMLVYRLKNTVDIRKLPGTIIAGAIIPMCLVSVTYLNNVNVSIPTLLILVSVQALGGFAGASVVAKLNIRVLRFIMGTALLTSAVILFTKQFILHLEGGAAIGLSPLLTVIAACINCFLGALAMMGFGNITVVISMLLLMGMSPLAVYPIVMTGGAFGCICGCARFIRDGNYNRRIALIEMVAGCVGVLVAANLVTGMSPAFLQTLMILVMIYSSISLFKENWDEKHKKNL